MIFNSMKRGVFILGVCVGLLNLAYGQGTAAPVAQQRTQISFMLVSGAIPVPGAFFDNAKKTAVPVGLGGSGKSPLYLYDGKADFALFVSPKDQPTVRRELVSLTLPITSKQILVLLAKSPKSTDAMPSYVGIAVDDDWTVFPAGSVRVLNYSGKKLSAKIGAALVELGNGPAKAINIADVPSGAKEVDLQIASLEGTAYELAYTNKVKPSATHRYTVVVLPPAVVNAGGVLVAMARETAPSTAKPGSKPVLLNR
jgi:hypothetical protein